MRRYELMVILDPDLEEKTVAPSLETYLKIIKDGGGKVNKLDIWGKRRMSFFFNCFSNSLLMSSSSTGTTLGMNSTMVTFVPIEL